jgi:hypothetical protein
MSAMQVTAIVRIDLRRYVRTTTTRADFRFVFRSAGFLRARYLHAGLGLGPAAVNADGLSTRRYSRERRRHPLARDGEGQTSPEGLTADSAPPAPHPVFPVSVTIGGQTVIPTYAGAPDKLRV